MFDIIGIDSSCVDHIISIDRMPNKDEEITIKRQSKQGGGKVATALVAAQRLGAATALMGVMGDDVMGRFLIDDLVRDGVDVSNVIIDKGKRSDYCISLAEKENSSRAFLVDWGDHREFTPEDINPELFEKARCVHLFRMNSADIAAAKLARKLGLKVAFDADAYDASIIDNIALIDIFIGSEFFYKSMFPQKRPQEACAEICQMGPQLAIFTFGAEGCVGVSGSENFWCDAFKVDAVDTTGAGDTFHGAFLYAYICENMPAEKAAQFASAVSAIKCMYMGGRAGLPERSMVTSFMENGSFDQKPLTLREERFGCVL